MKRAKVVAVLLIITATLWPTAASAGKYYNTMILQIPKIVCVDKEFVFGIQILSNNDPETFVASIDMDDLPNAGEQVIAPQERLDTRKLHKFKWTYYEVGWYHVTAQATDLPDYPHHEFEDDRWIYAMDCENPPPPPVIRTTRHDSETQPGKVEIVLSQKAYVPQTVVIDWGIIGSSDSREQTVQVPAFYPQQQTQLDGTVGEEPPPYAIEPEHKYRNTGAPVWEGDRWMLHQDYPVMVYVFTDSPNGVTSVSQPVWTNIHHACPWPDGPSEGPDPGDRSGGGVVGGVY